MKTSRTLDIKNQKPLDREKIEAICAQIASLPVLDARTPDEILDYDEFGRAALTSPRRWTQSL